MRQGGGCGTLSMAATTFENDPRVWFSKTVVCTIDLTQMFGQSHVTLAIHMKRLTRGLLHLSNGMHTTCYIKPPR